jgi:hypothetical protein
MIVVPSGLLRVTHRYIVERERRTDTRVPRGSPVFAEVCGEPVTRASLCDAIRRVIVLVRVSSTIRVDAAGQLIWNAALTASAVWSTPTT